MGQSFRIAIAALLGLGVLAGPAFAQSDPPGRVARLAFTEGAVSFHDDEQSDWTQALINTPLTSGDSIWTEAGARSEISLAGTRVRLDGSTQLDLLQVDDTQTKMQLAQGRLDIKTFTLDTNTPYQIVTPRGTITLNQQGDYYVLAGSTQDATRIGVRSGAASFQGLNGQTLAIRANEVGEVSGDSATPQLRMLNTAPPAMSASWATRDRVVAYDAPQYVNAGMTGYEDLNANGTWSSDAEYGQVWTPRSVPAGWEPYRTGRWQYVKPWGWTWVDEQPWGFAPYHYGRWANRNNRWSWVPPQRETRPVYAPALVAFIGGIELSISLGGQSRAPVGWFPLAPREAYVPPYTTNRTYYDNVNRSNRIQETMLEDRWQHAQRRDTTPDRSRPDRFVSANQRYATVVPSEDFVRSRPVARALIKVALDKLTAAPVARVSAPPAPAHSVNAAPPPATPAAAPPAAAPSAASPPAATPPAATTPPGTRPGATAPAPTTPPGTARGPNAPRPAEPKAADPKAEAEAKAKAEIAAKNVPATQTEVGGIAVLGKPTAPERPKAPGPKVVSRPPAAAAGAPQTHPTLQPRVGNAPPALKDDKAPPAAPAKPGQPPQANAPAPADIKPATPPAPAKPEPPKPGQTDSKPPAPATQPPVAQPPAPPATNPREGRRPDAPRTEPQRPASPPQREAAPAAPPAQPEAAPQQAAPPPAAAPAAPKRDEPTEGQRNGRDDNRRGG